MGDHEALDEVKADAVSRALRTLAQGVGAAVLVAVVVALTAATSDGIEWTQEYWTGVVGLVGNAAIVSALAYLHRRYGGAPGV
jgi:uncharacterized PurR-regulated membrane protein YhhQ (DUF165 family)